MEQFKLLKRKIISTPFFNSPFFLKHSRLIIPGIVLVIAILISALVTIPQFLKLFDTFKTIDQLNTKKTFYQKKINELQTLDIVQYRKDLETALIALPVDKDIPGLTGELLVALSSSGMNLVGIGFSSDSPESEKVQEYTLKIEVTGTEGNLNNFLERVKLSPQIVKLSSIDVSRGQGNSISASLEFVTLYQSLPQNIGSVDENVPELTSADFQSLADIEVKVKALPHILPGQASSSAVGKLDPFQN